MKKTVFIIIVLLGLSQIKADAQYVRRKPGFSVNISVGAPGPPPNTGAVWVEPGWAWKHGRYVEVPGYWVKTPRHGSHWVPGRWVYTNHRGYRWNNGRWR